MLPAIVLVGYNRPHSISRLMKSVNEAYYPDEEITLVVSLDYSDKTDEIINEINDIGWNNGKLIIRKFDSKQGLKQHVLSCGDLVNEYGAVIVLEDDLVVSPDFYNYTIQMLASYAEDERVCGISLYTHAWNGYGNYEFKPQKNKYDVFWGQIGVSWGQCWTKKQWDGFRNWYEVHSKEQYLGDNIPWSINMWGDQSWAKYFYKYMVENNKFYIFPYTSLSTNFSEIGEHNNGEPSNSYQVMLVDDINMNYRTPSYDEAIKYDMYFERMLDENTFISGIKGDDICFNLNGFKKNTGGKRYLITCKLYEGKEYLCSFGLRMRPIEQNILKNIQGNDIFLYDTKEWDNIDISNYRRTNNKRIKYEIYDNPVPRLVTYCNFEKEEIVRRNLSVNINAVWNEKNSFNIVQNVMQEEICKKRNDGTIWMLHQVYDDKSKYIDSEYAISPQNFEKLINKYIGNGYVFRAINEVESFKNEKNISITFDDGYRGVYKYIYPICKKYNIPFTIFVTLNFIGRDEYLNIEELKELDRDKLCTIGSHTFNHPFFRALNKENKFYEIAESKAELERLLGHEIEIFAYPYGSLAAVDYDTIKSVEAAGYKKAFSTLQTFYTKELQEELKYFIPRININDESVSRLIDQI